MSHAKQRPMHGRSNILLCLWLATIHSSCVSCQGANEPENRFAITGTYEFFAFQLGPAAPPGWTNYGTFEVKVDGRKWSVSCKPEQLLRLTGPPVIVNRLEAAFDGETLYQLCSTDVPSEYKASPKTSSTNYPLGMVMNGPVPQRLDTRIQCLWLGLGSGQYFRDSKPGQLRSLMLPPPDPLIHDNFRLRSTTWRLSTFPPHCPEWIVYGGDDNGTNLTQGKTPLSTNVEMTVLGWTNVADSQLPVLFTVKTFFLTNLSMQMSCKVQTLATGATSPVLPPALSDPTWIQDSRLTNRKPFTPIAGVSRRWPSLDDARASQVRADAGHRLSERSRAWVRWLFFCIVALSAALLFVWRRAFQGQEQ